jgi:hypothetical protein
LHHRLLRAAAYMTWRWLHGLWLLLPLSFTARVFAQADSALLWLQYSRAAGAEQCLAETELVRAVEARLGRRVFATREAADLIAEVQAAPERGGWTIQLRLLDGERRLLGERRLTTGARHCSALDEPLALVLSLAADVRRELPAAPHGPPAPSGGPDAQDVPRRPLATPIAIPTDSPAPRVGFALRPSVGGAVAFGLLPRGAIGARARLELVPPNFWPMTLEATGWRGQRLGRERGVRFAIQTLGFGVCPFRVRVGAAEIFGCLEQSIGKLAAKGFGFDEAAPSDRWWAALGSGGAIRYALGPVFLSVTGSLLVPLVERRYFYTDGADITLYRAPWLLGTVAGTVGAEF